MAGARNSTADTQLSVEMRSPGAPLQLHSDHVRLDLLSSPSSLSSTSSGGPVAQATTDDEWVVVDQDKDSALMVCQKKLWEEKIRRVNAEELLKRHRLRSTKLTQTEAELVKSKKQIDELLTERELMREQLELFEKDFKQEQYERRLAAEERKKFERGCRVLQMERDGANTKARELEMEIDRLRTELFRLSEQLRSRTNQTVAVRSRDSLSPVAMDNDYGAGLRDSCQQSAAVVHMHHGGVASSRDVTTNQSAAQSAGTNQSAAQNAATNQSAAQNAATNQSVEYGAVGGEAASQAMCSGSEQDMEFLEPLDDTVIPWKCQICSHENLFKGGCYCSNCLSVDKYLQSVIMPRLS